MTRHVFVRGDIGDPRAWSARCCAEHRPRAIVNFAAESHVDRSIDGPGRVHRDQRRRHLQPARRHARVVDGAAAGRARRVSASCTCRPTRSTARCPRPNRHSPRRTAYAPNSPYSASKAASDHLVRAYHHTYGLPTLTTNCSNNYGPYQFPEKLIPLMIVNALAGKPLPVYGDGQNVRDWLYVGDHCSAIRAVLAARTTRRDLQHRRRCRDEKRRRRARDSARCWRTNDPGRDYSSLITFVTDRPGHDRRYAIDSAKIRARARLDAGGNVRVRLAAHDPLVSRQPGLARERGDQGLSEVDHVAVRGSMSCTSIGLPAPHPNPLPGGERERASAQRP